MNSNVRDTRTAPAEPTHDDRQDEEQREQHGSEREGRIAAEQLAAPPTRRWRRPERLGRSS